MNKKLEQTKLNIEDKSKTINAIWFTLSLFLILQLFALIDSLLLHSYIEGWHTLKTFRYFIYNSYSITILSLLFLLLGKFKKIYFAILVFISFLNIPISYMLYKYLQTGIDPEIFYIIMDFMQVHLIIDFMTLYFTPVTLTLISIFLILLFITYLALIRFLFKSKLYSEKKYIIFAFATIATLLVLRLIFIHLIPYNKYTFYMKKAFDAPWYIKTYKSYYSYKNSPNFINRINVKNLPELIDSYKMQNKLDSDIVGLVMVGESTTSKAMQIYGYERENTPNIKNIIDSNNGKTFLYDGKTIYQQTSTSLLTTLSFSEYEKPMLSAPLSDILKNYQIQSYLLKNKYHVQLSLQTVFKNTISLYEVPNNVEIDKYHDDNMILPLSDAFENPKSNKECFMIHFKGHHFIYETKYPKEFKIYDNTIDKYTQNIKDPYDMHVYNTYDNATKYFDFVFDKIINKLSEQKKPAFAIFFSDHGEGSIRSEMRGAKNQDLDRIRSIPVIIWVSNEYIEKYPEVVKNLQLNEKKKTLISTSIIFTILDLFRIECEDDNKSLLNENYVEYVESSAN